jgi:hypothetical protein
MLKYTVMNKEDHQSSEFLSPEQIEALTYWQTETPEIVGNVEMPNDLFQGEISAADLDLLSIVAKPETVPRYLTISFASEQLIASQVVDSACRYLLKQGVGQLINLLGGTDLTPGYLTDLVTHASHIQFARRKNRTHQTLGSFFGDQRVAQVAVLVGLLEQAETIFSEDVHQQEAYRTFLNQLCHEVGIHPTEDIPQLLSQIIRTLEAAGPLLFFGIQETFSELVSQQFIAGVESAQEYLSSSVDAQTLMYQLLTGNHEEKAFQSLLEQLPAGLEGSVDQEKQVSLSQAITPDVVSQFTRKVEEDGLLYYMMSVVPYVSRVRVFSEIIALCKGENGR